jgi:hypothetical protein
MLVLLKITQNNPPICYISLALKSHIAKLEKHHFFKQKSMK